MMKSKIYIGHKFGSRSEIFRSAFTPTEETHGNRYFAVTGPFRTLAGARFMALFGQGNPHCRCVSEAEKLAKHYSAQYPELHGKTDSPRILAIISPLPI